MWMRRGAHGRDIDRRMQAKAVGHLNASGVDLMLTYDAPITKAQRESIRRVTKGRLATLRAQDGRDTLLVPSSCCGFITDRIGPGRQTALDADQLGVALDRSPVRRMDGLLGPQKFKAAAELDRAAVAQGLEGCATTARSNLIPDLISIRPSTFWTPANLGVGSRQDFHQMGYRFHDDLPTNLNIAPEAAPVVPYEKEADMQAEHTELLRQIAANTAALPELKKDLAAIRKILAEYDAGRITREERDRRISRCVN